MLCDAQPGAEDAAGAPGGFELRFPADPLSVRSALRAAVARFLRQMTADEAGTLELVLAEVLNNVVEHAYADTGAGEIELAIDRTGEGLACTVTDAGLPMPGGALPGSCANPVLPDPEALPEGGFGWCLIRDLTEGLSYCRKAGRNVLAFRLPLAPH